MSLRISTQLELVAGFDNQLNNKAFGGPLLAELLDTLAHEQSGGPFQLAGNEVYSVPFGNVVEARYLYLEADGECDVTLGGGTATHAERLGVGGTYPTAFAGGETLSFKIDDVLVAVAFTAADQTRDEIVARINFAAALAGFLATPVALQSGSQLKLRSPTTGIGSSVEVLAGGTALATLGLTVGRTLGVDAQPGTSAIHMFRPADPTGSAAAQGVKSYLLATVKTTAVTVTNLSPTEVLNLKTFVAGDLVTAPC
jgi:hypothetical protein